MKFYKLKCKICKKITDHSIYHLSKRKGVKVFCLECENKKSRYYNLKKLEAREWTITKTDSNQEGGCVDVVERFFLIGNIIIVLGANKGELS